MTISQSWSFQGSILVLSLTGLPVPTSLWPLCTHGTLLCHVWDMCGCVCHGQKLLEKALLTCPFNMSPSQALEQGTMSDKNPEITPRFSLPKLKFFHDYARNPPQPQSPGEQQR